MKNVLKLENVTMQFGGVVAVDNLNMDVNEGEIVALIGPNGAGKTTAFNVITGVYAPSNGRVCFNEKCIVRNHPTGKMKKTYKGEHPAMYTAQLAPEETLEDEALKTWKQAQKERDEFAFSDHILAPTPDKITALGMARTFQNNGHHFFRDSHFAYPPVLSLPKYINLGIIDLLYRGIAQAILFFITQIDFILRVTSL